MSFGSHQYQHRFHQDKPSKRVAVYSPESNNLLPLQNSYSKYVPITRADSMGGREILYTLPSDELDYTYNSLMLERYKRDAELYKKYKRYGSVYDRSYVLPPIRRIATEPFIDGLLPETNVVYVDKSNPELYNMKSLEYAALVRQNLMEKERELMRSQQEKEKQKIKAQQYKKKYNKLKRKIKDDIIESRFREADERRRRELELQSQRKKIQQIQYAMHDMSYQLANNSRILEENVKLKETLERSNELSRSKIIVFPNVPSILQTPILFDKPKLDTQYKQMYRLKKQIKELDHKLGNSSKY